MPNEVTTTEETPTNTSEVLLANIRTIVREEIDTALQDVLRTGDAPSHAEVKKMIEGAISDTRRETGRLLDNLRAEREQKANEMLTRYNEGMESIRNQVEGFAEMSRMVRSNVDNLTSSVRDWQKQREMNVAAWQDSHEKRISSVTAHVGRLDDRVDRIEPVVDQVRTINETISKLDGKVETVVHFAEWRMKEVEKWENRWQNYIMPFLRWGLTVLLGSGAGLGGYELIK